MICFRIIETCLHGSISHGMEGDQHSGKSSIEDDLIITLLDTSSFLFPVVLFRVIRESEYRGLLH